MTILINPDVHGRHFWELSKEYVDEVDKIVFLGDYFDPYPYEHDPYRPSKEDKNVLGDTIEADSDMISNFKNIIKFKKNYPDKVVLLLGNHDVQYISSVYRKLCKTSRYCVKYSDTIVKLLEKNRALMQYAYSMQCHDMTGKEYTLLFTHAGINEGWYSIYTFGKNDLLSGYRADELVGVFNSVEEDSALFEAMCNIGWYRGGYDEYGSPLWSDFSEFVGTDDKDYVPFKEDLFQIVGHTQLTKIPLVLNNIICCDIRRPFLFNTEKKELYELNGTRCLRLKEFKALSSSDEDIE